MRKTNVMMTTLAVSFGLMSVIEFCSMGILYKSYTEKLNSVMIASVNSAKNSAADMKEEKAEYNCAISPVIDLNTNEESTLENYIPSEAEQTLNEYYALIPEKIRDCFDNSDWTYGVYTEGRLCDLCGYDTEIMGITLWSNHVILIDKRDNSASAIVHEIGHWASRYYMGGIDYVLANEAFSDEWRTLYSSFGGSKNNYDTEEEYVAEAFSLYVLRNSELLGVAPETYILIDNFVNNH